MSEQGSEYRHGDESPEDDQFYDAYDSLHGHETEEHDHDDLADSAAPLRASSGGPDVSESIPSYEVLMGMLPELVEESIADYYTYTPAVQRFVDTRGFPTFGAEPAGGDDTQTSSSSANPLEISQSSADDTSTILPASDHDYRPPSEDQPADQPHLDTPRASISASAYHPSAPSTEDSSDWRRSTGAHTSQWPESTPTATDMLSTGDSTYTGSEKSYGNAPASRWQPFSHGFQPSLEGVAEDSPVSPLTVQNLRQHQPTGQGTDTTDFATQSTTHSALSMDYSEPDSEGISLQKALFSRPRSQHSSVVSSSTTRRVPGLLTPRSHDHTASASKLFIDPLTPPSADLDLGLPSMRHLLESETTPSDGDRKPDAPPVTKDKALVNHLERLQRDATLRWDWAHTAPSDEDKKGIITDLVRKLWQTNVHHLADLLKANQKLRRLAGAHRQSLGEVDKLRQDSRAAAGQVADTERDLGGNLAELREENKKLRTQLALRDIALAEFASEQDESLRMGSWVEQQPFVPDLSAQVGVERPADEITSPMGEGTGDEQEDWASLQPPLKDRPRDEARKRGSWDPNPDIAVELIQKIAQLRNDVSHEKFEKDAAQEMVVKLQKDLDHVLGLAEADEALATSGGPDDLRTVATRRIAEIVGSRAALRTAQQNYEKGQAECAILQKTCDALEERIAERDEWVRILERDLGEVRAELVRERGERTDAMLRVEEVEARLAESEKLDREKTAEVARVEGQLSVLLAELEAAQADVPDLKKKLAELEQTNYDLVADNVYKLQCAEHEQKLRELKEAELEEARGELAETETNYKASRAELESRIHELEDANAEYEAEEAALRKKIESENSAFADLEYDLALKDERIEELRETVRQLEQAELEGAGTADDAPRADLENRIHEMEGAIADYKAAEVELRRQRDRERGLAARRKEMLEMAARRSRAEQRSHRKHRALTRALRDLGGMIRPNQLYSERERQLIERLAVLEKECEERRLALQEALKKSREKEGDGKPKPVVGSPHTPQPPRPIVQERIVTRVVQHHHSEACFCSLVDYWFPGALDWVLSRCWDTDDSGYGDSIEEYDDVLGLGSGSETEDVDDDYIRKRDLGPQRTRHSGTKLRTASSETRTPPKSRSDRRPPRVHFEVYEASESDNAGLGGWGLSLRGGAGSPDDSVSDASFGWDEKMASFTTGDDGWGGASTPKAPVKTVKNDDDDAASDTLTAFYERTQDKDALLEESGDSPRQSVKNDVEPEPSSPSYKRRRDKDTLLEETDDEPPRQRVKTEQGVAATTAPKSSHTSTTAPKLTTTPKLPTAPKSTTAPRSTTPAKSTTAPKPTVKSRPARLVVDDADDESPGLTFRPNYGVSGRPQPLQTGPALAEATGHEQPELPLPEADSYMQELLQTGPPGAGQGISTNRGPTEALPQSQALDSYMRWVESELQMKLMQTGRLPQSQDFESYMREFEAETEKRLQTGRLPQSRDLASYMRLVEFKIQELMQAGGISQSKDFDSYMREFEAETQKRVWPAGFLQSQEFDSYMRWVESEMQEEMQELTGGLPQSKDFEPYMRKFEAETQKFLRGITFPEPPSPVIALLDLIDSGGGGTPPPNDNDDAAFYPRHPRRRYHGHGHTTADGPFECRIYLLCQVLTALAWLGMLVLAQPGNLFSTLAIFAGYLVLPMRFALQLAAHYLLRLPFYYARRPVRRLLGRAPPRRPARPNRPVLRVPSAAKMVGSVVTLGVVYVVFVLQAVAHERGVWMRSDRWTEAYLADVVAQEPYPWWSPLDVDFRLAAREWMGWKANAVVFGGRYLKMW